MPPPAESLAVRLTLGPALRAQPDRRLVALVRDGYETAFEEIVRRYGVALRRYAAGIVGGRAEDVTQDAFSKALLAMRRDGREIELRPWLFRIVRNTALNDLRDSPPSPEQLAESLAVGGRGPAEVLERREELAELIRRLRALPEPQRAAIVMRELEGLSHEEIAAALGLSGGAARQAIYRARQALREGFGMLLPLPLLKAMLDWTGSAPFEAAAAGAGAGGAGVALKAATATVLIAGAVGAGFTIDRGHPQDSPTDASAARLHDDASARAFPGGTLAAAGQGDTPGRERRGDGTTKGETTRGGEHEDGDRGPSSGSGSEGHGSGPGDDGGGGEPSHHGGGESNESSGPGGGDDGSSSGPGSGDESPSTSSGEVSSSGEGSTEQTSGTDDSGDSESADGFSVQATQP
jgi:RNA polymerase sigma factor (sigma-70 family)